MDYTPDWLKNVVVNLDNKINEFFTYYNWLGDNRAKIPEALYGEYSDLLSRGYSLEGKINTAKSFVSQAKAWLSSVFGASNQLGLAPIVPVAIVASGVAALALLSAITYWVSDAVKFRSKMNAVVTAGGSAADVIAAGQGEKGIFGNIESIVQWAVIGFAAYMLLNRKGR